ncbi:hypothetical protein ACFRR7_17900 [Streptomyces sp. NPDC056909]|uniref:hypothetical protein n=1 Tax=Streptomyces sp. NPDC056909 TaxID=3345963 RepID=UPI0036AA416D
MTTAEEYGTVLEPVKVFDAELVENNDAPGTGEVAVRSPAAAVLAALEYGAEKELHRARTHKTRTGYARD